MSETPLPPPPPGATPPPPPPPSLTAPPGYVGYHATPMGSVPLKRITGVARAASALVAATGLVSLAAALMTRTVVDDAEAFLDGDTSRDDFLTAITPYALLSFLQLIALVASAVVVIVWMHRIATNLRSLHRGATWGPGWAIGGWFAPPFANVIPFLTLREMWKASDPDVPIGGDWRERTASPLVTAWFILFGPVQVALFVAQLGDTFSGIGGSERVMAEQISGSQVLPSIGAAVDVVAAVLFVLVVRGLTDRHRRLTGELAG